MGGIDRNLYRNLYKNCRRRDHRASLILFASKRRLGFERIVRGVRSERERGEESLIISLIKLRWGKEFFKLSDKPRCLWFIFQTTVSVVSH